MADLKHLVVVVPGIMGSELRLGNEVIWPGPFSSLVSSYPEDLMAKLMREDLQATDVIREYLLLPQYQALIDDLQTCGFIEHDTLLLCPYDWRKDNMFAAKTLSDDINAAVEAHGGPGATTVSIIAHSMGGLISRYYLESGEFSAQPGFSAVHQLIALATPHRGAPLALTAAMGQERRLFLSADQVLRIVSDPRYPAVYQLLPPPGEPFAWDGDYNPVDIYDQQVTSRLQLVPDNLVAARAFLEKLDITHRPAGVHYFFFVGTQGTTFSTATLFRDEAGYQVSKIEPEDAGDGTVPSWSGTLTGMQSLAVGGEHSVIYQSSDLRLALARLLGCPEVLAATLRTGRVEVTLASPVVHPNMPWVDVVLRFGPDAITHGEIRVEPALFDSDHHFIKFSASVTQVPVDYTGLAGKLKKRIGVPPTPGVYRVAYYPSGQKDPEGIAELFVRQE